MRYAYALAKKKNSLTKAYKLYQRFNLLVFIYNIYFANCIKLGFIVCETKLISNYINLPNDVLSIFACPESN